MIVKTRLKIEKKDLSNYWKQGPLQNIKRKIICESIWSQFFDVTMIDENILYIIFGMLVACWAFD